MRKALWTEDTIPLYVGSAAAIVFAIFIVHWVGYDRLVLTACHPLYSAAQRIAGFARLTEVSFFALGDRTWYDP